MSEENSVIVNRDYTDNFAIKENVISTLGKKYFGDTNLSNLNIGQLGLTLEQMANIAEDSFNTASVFINEAFPTKAVMPNSIYSHASIFQIDDSFKPAAICSFIMLLSEEEILRYGTTSAGVTKAYIDRDTTIMVENIPFTFDYDIEISATIRQVNGSEQEYLFAAQYVLDGSNSVSTLTDPYLKIRRTGDGRLLLQLTARQIVRSTIEDNVITNTKLNYSVLEFNFTDALAGFDIWYKPSYSTTYTRLDKRVKFSIPVKSPFCFYKLKNENTLEITFSTREGYFQPEFNSEIMLVLHTTKGSSGNFDSYNGTNIVVKPFIERYAYNDSLTIAVKPISGASGGADQLSLDDVQALTVEAYSTANEISTESDIMTYFYNFKHRYGDEMLVLKRRDDLSERLFSSFILVKNSDYIYPTNTSNIDIEQSQFDVAELDNVYILKAGHVFIYESPTSTRLKMVDDIMVYDVDAVNALLETEKFVYTNPFLISTSKSPSLVGLYKTITNETSSLIFSYANPNSLYQYITSQMHIERSIEELSRYLMSMAIIPSSSTEKYVTNLNTYVGNDVRIIIGFIGSSGEEIGYMELLPTSIAENDSLNVTFSTYVETNDIITSLGEMYITNAVSLIPGVDIINIPITDAKVNAYILHKDVNAPNKFSGLFPDIDDYSISNTYIMDDSSLTFIEPMNMMRSTVSFSNIGTDVDPIVNFGISLLPMIKADIVQDTDNFAVFIEKFTNTYNYMQLALPVLRNNTNIDIKFYNTYGRSSNYYIGDNSELIDRVDISISFSIKLIDGVDYLEAKDDISDFIKSFIEKIDPNGVNALYISNLISDLENSFPIIKYLKFKGINEYSTDYQTITVVATDLNTLDKDERINYVPEMIVINRDNVNIIFE